MRLQQTETFGLRYVIQNSSLFSLNSSLCAPHNVFWLSCEKDCKTMFWEFLTKKTVTSENTHLICLINFPQSPYYG